MTGRRGASQARVVGYDNPHNDAHQWGAWKDNGAFGEVRYCLDCDEVEHR